MTTEQGVQKAKQCLYCGNNPTIHSNAWIDSVIAFSLNSFFETFSNSRPGKFLLRFAEQLMDYTWNVLIMITVVRFSDAPTLPPTARGKVLFDEAQARGWKMETAIIFTLPVDVYRITFRDGKVLNFSGLPRLDVEKAAATGWIDDKAMLKARLGSEGIPVSRGEAFHDIHEAREYFARSPKPMIIKPRLGSRGRHTTTHLYTFEEFAHAFQVAKQLGVYVVLEEHLFGSVYRATMVDGVLAGVLAGDPPRVTGDGAHTIAELIEIKNAHRHERVAAFVPSELTHLFLKRQGYTLDTVLSEGVTIDLTEKIGLSYGGKSREVTPQVHPKLREELERAARIVNDPIIGFDFITPDVRVDPGTVRWGIIECNALPFINLHHDPLEGEPVNVAGIFLDYIEREFKKHR